MVVALPTETDGNALDAEKVFQCAEPGKTASAPRVWRLTGAQYGNVVKSAVGGKTPSGYVSPFGPAAVRTRFANYASSFGMLELEMDTLLASAEVVARHVVKSSPTCAPAYADACLDGILRPFGERMFRRPFTAEDLTRFRALFAKLKATAGPEPALLGTIEAIATHPDAVYRSELGAGAADAGGRLRLSPHEIASALSFTVTDGPPDALLLEAAAGGQLATREQVAQQARRLITAPGAPSLRAILTRFLTQYLRYDESETVFKDVEGYRSGDIVSLGNKVVNAGLDAEKDLLTFLLRTDSAFLAGNQGTSPIVFGVTEKVPYAGMWRSFPGRFGILGHPSWLIAFSQNTETDPIRRGKFVYESFLCGLVPDVALDTVPPLPERGPQTTVREQLAMHTSNPACSGCHSLMDPIGLGLEAFDHLGRLRTTEAGRPVDTTGRLVGSGATDGPFNGADELTKKLLASPRVSGCFVRHAFRFALGRSETPADACTLAGALKSFKDSGENLSELFVALLSSDSFLFRRQGATP